MSQLQGTFLQRLSNALHIHYDGIEREPLPDRWVDLIRHLDEKERKYSKRHRPEAEPSDRRER